MRFIYLIILASFLFTSNSFASEFCDGYKAGYKQGYKRAHNTNFNPFTPFCPFKPFKQWGDPESDFEFGYIEGLEDGMSSGY